MEAALNGRCGIQMSNEIAVEASDVELMLRFKEGDAEAFDRLFARHMRPVINFAFRFVRDRGAAEELAQEVFLRVYEAAANYEVQAKFTTWLYKIATNVCLNEIRKPHIRAAMKNTGRDGDDVSLAHLDTCGIPASPDRLLEQESIARALRRALEQVPEKQRIAFILSKYQELSYMQVAEIMKISEKAVKSLIHRAKETLAEKLKPLLPELINI
jgi:RNA polymerase sigma-70 factor (ECF subfamily)